MRSARTRQRKSRCAGNTEVEEPSRWRWSPRRSGAHRNQTVNPSGVRSDDRAPFLRTEQETSPVARAGPASIVPLTPSLPGAGSGKDLPDGLHDGEADVASGREERTEQVGRDDLLRRCTLDPRPGSVTGCGGSQPATRG